MKKRNIPILTIALLGSITLSAIVLSEKSNIFNVNGIFEHDSDCYWNHYQFRAPTIDDPGCEEYWVCCEHHTFSLTKPTSGKNLDADPLRVSDDTIAYLKDNDTDLRYIAPNCLFLPSKITRINDTFEDSNSITTFIYDDDLLGYTSVEQSTFFKNVNTFRFNSTFTSYTEIEKTYIIKNEKEELDTYRKYEFSYLDDLGSYEIANYEFYDEEDRFVLMNIKGKTFNKKHQVLTNYYLKPLDEDEKTLYKEDETIYSYDEDGFILSEYTKEYDLKLKKQYTYAMSSYFYDEPNHAHCTRYDFISRDGMLVSDGTIDINITFEDNLIKFDEQNYFPSGDLGNHNVFHYNNDWVRVYAYYGGLDDESGITLNEYNQKEAYIHNDYENEISESITASYSPNGGNIKYCNILFDGSYSQEKQTYFTYNELNQITGGTAEIEDVIPDEPLPITYNDTISVEYSSKQNYRLLEHMNYIDDILYHLGHYMLCSDEWLV